MAMHKYKIARQGVIIGEYQVGSIQRMIDAGDLLSTDYAWTNGMAEWKRLTELGFQPPSEVRPKPAPATSGDHAEARAQTTARRVAHEPSCPGCGSKSVQAASIGFAAGTRDSESVGVSSRGRVYYRIGRSASRLANALAPPSAEGPNPIFGFLMVGAFFLGVRGCTTAPSVLNGTGKDDPAGWAMVFFAVILFFMFFYFRHQSAMESEAQHDLRMKDYSRKWFCKKCGAVFSR